MNNREAIEKFKDKKQQSEGMVKMLIENFHDKGMLSNLYKEHVGVIEMCDLAISALEKQVAKKTIVKFHKDWDADFPYCPVCDTPIDIVDDYCYKCGQRLGEE